MPSASPRTRRRDGRLDEAAARYFDEPSTLIKQARVRRRRFLFGKDRIAEVAFAGIAAIVTIVFPRDAGRAPRASPPIRWPGRDADEHAFLRARDERRRDRVGVGDANDSS